MFDYIFGDGGFLWCMMKFKVVYIVVNESGCFVEDIVLEWFGSFEDFDVYCEEKEEFDWWVFYGKGY